MENEELQIQEEISIILEENRDWKDVHFELPKENIPVVIRIKSKKKIISETEDTYFPEEDIKIATYDYDEKRFIICPPFPKYDDSPLSNNADINEDAEVTNWAYPADGEFDRWKQRLDVWFKYDNFKIEIDQEHAKLLYQAILVATSHMQAFFTANEQHGVFNEEDKKTFWDMINILKDVKALMDNDIFIKAGIEYRME